MAKLTFRYAAMNSGKSTDAIQMRHNYLERDMDAVLLKSTKDRQHGDMIRSRLGVEVPVDVMLEDVDDARESIQRHIAERALRNVQVIIADEAQFLEPHHVDELWHVAKEDNISVVALGLKTDFQTLLFPGSKRLIELADVIEEKPTMCRCGSQARYNGRKADGRFTFEGEQVVLDNSELEATEVTYESLCADCYLRERASFEASLAAAAIRAVPYQLGAAS